ncbi:MAG: hypothetical protein WAW96_21840 [Alphaproteobacteria bacterium]
MLRRIFYIFAILSSAATAAHADQVMWADMGWAEIRAGNAFAMTAPPGTVYRELSGEDIFTGEFVHPDFKISFEYGLWAKNLDSLKKGFARENAVFDGQAAIIVTGPGNGKFDCQDNLVAAYVKDVHAGVLAPVSLQIHGCAKDAREIPIMKRMFKSLRFGRLRFPSQ